eukprot:scaffold800_cov327-Pavlova_lutheri.AAC.17
MNPNGDPNEEKGAQTDPWPGLLCDPRTSPVQRRAKPSSDSDSRPRTVEDGATPFERHDPLRVRRKNGSNGKQGI